METSFLPGRTFTSPADFNTQLADWLPMANAPHGARASTARPVELVEPDRARCWRCRRCRRGRASAPGSGCRRDYYVRVDGNDYSVDPAVIGRMVERARRPGHGHGRPATAALVADHTAVLGHRADDHRPRPRRAAARLRQAFQSPASTDRPDGLLRDLADYDTAFGVDLDHADAGGQVA